MKILDLVAEIQGRRRKLRTLRVGNVKSEENIKNKIQRAAEGGWNHVPLCSFLSGRDKKLYNAGEMAKTTSGDHSGFYPT